MAMAQFGGVLGMLFFPLSLFVGPLLGAMVAEMLFAKNDVSTGGETVSSSAGGDVATIVSFATIELFSRIDAIRLRRNWAGDWPNSFLNALDKWKPSLKPKDAAITSNFRSGR